MIEKTAAEAIVDTLIANDVDTVFGLPGAQTYTLFDALYRRKDKIRTIGARHEQGIAYMAFGYARSTGKLGVYCPVPGPGMLNTTAAMCTAFGACAPTLCITGDVPSDFRGKGRGHLHELGDQLGILERLTLSASHIQKPEDAPDAINAAIRAATVGRKGPAAVSICWDTLGERAVIPDIEAVIAPPFAEPDPAQIVACVELIRKANHPMIFVGTGAQHASAQVSQFSNLIGAPVVAFRGGRGIVDEDEPLGLSMAAAWNLWSETDLVIGIGTRLEIPFMRWGSMMKLLRSLPNRKVIRIDIDPAEIARLDTDGPLIADTAIGLRRLSDALLADNFVRQDNDRRIDEAKRRANEEIRTIQPQMQYLDVIRKVLPRDGFFVEDLTQVGFASFFGWPVHIPRTYVSCGYQGTLGFGFPTALGVKVANPDRAVVSITGDGGFLYAMPELATAVQYNINVVTIVFDNGCYGNVRRDQESNFGGRLIGADLINPDFRKLAESFGVAAYDVASPAELEPALERALACKGPSLIWVNIPKGTEESPWRFIHAVPLNEQLA